MRTLIVAAVLCLIAAPARAEVVIFNGELIQRYFKLDEPIFIFFNDWIQDDCLPQPEAIKSTIDLGLRRSGLKPTDQQGTASWTLSIFVAAAEIRSEDKKALGICYARVDAKLILGRAFRDYSNPDERISLSVPGLVQGVVAYTGKPGTQSYIDESVNKIVDEFAIEILKALDK